MRGRRELAARSGHRIVANCGARWRAEAFQMPRSSYTEGDVASASPLRGKGGYLADSCHLSIASRRGAQGLARPVMGMRKMAVVIDFRGNTAAQ